MSLIDLEMSTLSIAVMPEKMSQWSVLYSRRKVRTGESNEKEE